jgi:glucose/arabinose dehydrogenase
LPQIPFISNQRGAGHAGAVSRHGIVSLAAVLAVALSGCAGASTSPQNAAAGGQAGLRVEVVTDALEHGWDVGFLPGGQALVTQRPGRLALLSSTQPGARVTDVRADFSDVMVRGEGGLMGLLVHPDFASSRRFTTCQTHREGERAVDVRLVTWELSPDGTSARRVVDPLLGGLPVNPSGRHSGCRPELGPDGSLMVGTGDTARNGIAQDRTRLGGKVLRIDLATGAPARGNPFLGSPDRNEQRVWSYGHRNVQGVARRPGTDQVFDVEHGPDRDDEINLLRRGANYGWGPVGSPNDYDEDVPMTDAKRFPDAVPAVWSSGDSTEATSGADFLEGPGWGDLQGALAVAALKGSKLMLFTLGPEGKVRQVVVPKELNNTNGRLRAVRMGQDNALYVTTSEGSKDKLLRITRG